MILEDLFTEQNIAGMRKLLTRMSEEGIVYDDYMVKILLVSFADTTNSDIIGMDTREIEKRLEHSQDAGDDRVEQELSYIVSCLRYAPLIYLANKEGKDMNGPTLVYDHVIEGMDETEAMPVYTRRKMVTNPGIVGQFKWHHTTLEEVAGMAEESKIDYLVFNPDTTPVLIETARVSKMTENYNLIDKGIEEAMEDGMQQDELFPALIERFYFRNVECVMKDGTKQAGFAALPEDAENEMDLELETDDDTDVIIHAEDLVSIRVLPDMDEEEMEDYYASGEDQEE